MELRLHGWSYVCVCVMHLIFFLYCHVQHKNRRENVEIQLKVVIALTTKYRDAFESLNSLISKTDIEFLHCFPTTTKHIESILDSEDKSLLRPVVNQHIPFYINKDVEKEIMSLGAVGGGLTPTDLGYSPSGSQGSLLELFWQLPEHCGKLSRFQIEYDQMTVERRGSGMVMESDNFVYAQSEPQFYEVPGNKLNSYMDYLCPGYNYRFRIRSANDAGWGMWSKPILGKCEGFPFTLEYTKSIHRLVVPISSYYRITVKGAKGEDGMIRRGGKGAIISATFALKAGDILILLCGGMSSRHHYHSGGGGGSFLALNEVSQSTLLIAAGGGGGTRGASGEDLDGSDASIYPDGKDGLGEDAGKGGLNGAFGEDARDKASEGPSFGNGGAGFIQDSSTARSFLSGGHGGQNGGFGGGGAVGMYGGGGGGGYSGGGGGRGGGGGGSYVISTAMKVTREVGNDKHGSVTIDRIAMPPYPISNVQGQSGSVSDLISTSDSTETSSSNQQMLPFTQMSSSSVGSGSNLTSNSSSKAISTASVGISIGMIPESSHESPASTNQVIDQARHVPATFTIGDPRGSNGNNDATIGMFSHGDGSSEVVGEDPSELRATVLPGTRMPASVLSEFIPTLGEYLGSSQATTAATTTTVAPGRVDDLINFNQQFLRETADSTLINKISPEEKALIAQQLIQQQTRKAYQPQSQLPLISAESNINPHSVNPSKSNMYQQQQQQPLMAGMSTSSPMRPTKHMTSPNSGIGAPEQSTTSQSQLPMQHDQDHLYQKQLAEMQRYIQSQQQQQQTQTSQHVQQQHLVQGSGKDDLSPPLTQQQQHVAMQHQQQLHQQPAAQPVNVHQPVPQHVQQQQLLQQQQQQQLQMQAGICDDNSQPLNVQQLVALASQSSIQPPNNGVEYSSPGQYGQQPSFDYTAHPNWNPKN